MSETAQLLIPAIALTITVWAGIWVIVDAIAPAVGRHRRRWGR